MLHTQNIVRHIESGLLYECTRSEKDGFVSVRDMQTLAPLRGGAGMFEDDHPAHLFEKIAISKHWLD